jgi:hypothetical protein
MIKSNKEIPVMPVKAALFPAITPEAKAVVVDAPVEEILPPVIDKPPVVDAPIVQQVYINRPHRAQYYMTAFWDIQPTEEEGIIKATSNINADTYTGTPKQFSAWLRSL